MKIIFNKDGSVKSKNLDRYINQNSENIEIEVEVDGLAKSEYQANAYFQLPNELVLTEMMEETENGYKVTLGNAETKYHGVLVCSFELIGDEINFTYPVNLTINKTVEIISSDYNTLNNKINSVRDEVAEIRQSTKLYRHFISFTETGGSLVFYEFHSKNVTPVTNGQGLANLQTGTAIAHILGNELKPHIFGGFANYDGATIMVNAYGSEIYEIRETTITDVVREVI